MLEVCVAGEGNAVGCPVLCVCADQKESGNDDVKSPQKEIRGSVM
jgi:hypothetical protein